MKPELLSEEDAEREFSRRPYWSLFQDNVEGDICLASYQGGYIKHVTGTYKYDPTIELRLESYLTFGDSDLPFASRTGMRVTRKCTSKEGIITHGITRSPRTYEEALFSSVLEKPKKSTWRCYFDFGLRRTVNNLYQQFRENGF